MAKAPAAVKAAKAPKVLDLSFIQERDADTLVQFCEESKALMKADFINRKKKFLCSVGDEQFETTLGPLVIALIAIKSRFLLSRDLSADDIIKVGPETSVATEVKKYFTATIEEAIEDADVNIDDLKTIIAGSLEEFADLTFEINQSAGNSVNIYDMLKLAERNPRVNELLNFKVDENSEYYATSSAIKAANKELLEELLKDDNNCYRNLILAISPGQFQQVFCNVGYKPEVVSSAIYPHCVNTNLFQGMRNEMDYFVSSMGARKALITNALQVRRAGYTSRKLLLLVLNQKLSETEDCESNDYVIMKIETKDALKRLHGRHHMTKSGLAVLNKHDDVMVGKNIKLRSPITCRKPNGEICKTCYGQLHRINPFHIGISGVLNLTEQLTQMLLSSKHLLQINPEKIELPKGLEEYFYVDKTNLIAKKSFKVNVQNIQLSDEDELYSNKIIITDGEHQLEFEFEEGKEVFLDLIDNRINTYQADNIIDVYEDNDIFRINIENTELITPLKKIIKLLESEALLNEFTYPELLVEFLGLLERSNIRSSSVTIELILRELIRDADNIQERPKDFKNPEGIKFLKLTNALVHHPSAAISLAFERMNYVVENNLFGKNQDSIIDPLY
jgi:hypothetical protein